ncbi:unnamed protein product [Didymodactylos carnosus]|uniref:Integrase zinc-binding domain-containing protein n=1 Tax=Didymodactylos carnosus TaxID=1234261 RepID=A0A8S2PKV3_9BILA|nr:unnamed protein product [Didymodactylos carnosus]CAF4395323.1 unnamed protein product [Didymodactylos carnosus]
MEDNSFENKSNNENVIPNHLDITKLIEEQDKDLDIQRKIREVEKYPHKHPYVLQDEVFYKLLSRDGGKTKSKLIYLPKSMIKAALRSYHDHPTAAHFSLERTYAKMKHKYWWPDMKQSISDYINSCIVCKQYNYSRRKKPGHLHPISPPSGPFQLIGMDYCGPFLVTPRENRYRWYGGV